MRQLAKTLLAACLAFCTLAAVAVPAQAAFGIKEFDATFTEGGGPATLAGSHPDSQTTTLAFNTTTNPAFPYEIPDGSPRNLTVSLPPGFIGDPTVVTPCTSVQFVEEDCPVSSQVATTDLIAIGPTEFFDDVPVYSVAAPPGQVLKLGFHVVTVPITIDLTVAPNPPYNVIAALRYNPNAVPLYKAELTVLGTPPAASKPFLTLPRACPGPLTTSFEATSWEEPAAPPLTGVAATPLVISGCESLEFGPTIAAAPSTSAAESSSGIDVDLEVDDPGLTEITGRADSDIKKTVVTLPEGVTTNPSIAAGLGACSLVQFNAESSLARNPVTGCPENSKVGSVEVTTPLLPQTLNGSVYVAQQRNNPFDSLLALYVVIRNENLGISVRLAGKVEPNPATGQLTTTFDEIPQFPVSHLRFHFRGGERAPLITPATCGTYKVDADLYPYSNPTTALRQDATFTINSGAAGAPCANSLGQLPHAPGFEAGTLSLLAGAFSPFVFKLNRADGSQRLSAVSTTLPKGLIGRLAGIPYCSEAQIAQAASRSGEGQGALEIAQPSCPAASQLGSATVGAGARAERY
jgi:hypothetical protein